MTIFVADWQMTSDTSDEVAQRVADKWEMAWRLSWLPDRLLTRAQAIAGMDLAEIFAGNKYRTDRMVQARAIVSAGELGIPVEQAIYLLLKRMRA